MNNNNCGLDLLLKFYTLYFNIIITFSFKIKTLILLASYILAANSSMFSRLLYTGHNDDNLFADIEQYFDFSSEGILPTMSEGETQTCLANSIQTSQDNEKHLIYPY